MTIWYHKLAVFMQKLQQMPQVCLLLWDTAVHDRKYPKSVPMEFDMQTGFACQPSLLTHTMAHCKSQLH